jgi:hypothetical protein
MTTMNELTTEDTARKLRLARLRELVAKNFHILMLGLSGWDEPERKEALLTLLHFVAEGAGRQDRYDTQ